LLVITADAHHMREFVVADVTLLVVATMIDVCGVLLPRKLRAQGAGGTALVLSPIGVAVLVASVRTGVGLRRICSGW
jgi:hypothetical protein